MGGRLVAIPLLAAAGTVLAVGLATATSVATLELPTNDQTFYTGGAAHADVPVKAKGGSDSCDSGLLYLERAPASAPNSFSTLTGGPYSTPELTYTDQPVPGDYYYRARLDCASPADDDAVSQTVIVHVIAGAAPTPTPTATATATATARPTPQPPQCAAAPNLIGLTFAKAKTRFARSDCDGVTLRKIGKRSRRGRATHVKSQRPRPGKPIKAGGQLVVTMR